MRIGQTCSTCIFFSPSPTVKSGQCRESPPDHRGFPITNPKEWCGRWEEQPETQETWELTEAGAELVAKLQRGEKLTPEETAQMDKIADDYSRKT